MARKKKAGTADESHSTNAKAGTAATSVTAATVTETPGYIDGPPANDDGRVVASDESGRKDWGNPYRAVVSTASFEMGEDRRFKQRVFKFKDKPADEVIAALKENGFTYRAHEKAWTIPANAESRVLTDRLAQEFAGHDQAASR